MGWLDPCSPRHSQVSSPRPQFKSVNFSALCLLYGPTLISIHQFNSVQFSCSVVSDSLQPHGLQHVRLSYPSPTPRAFEKFKMYSWQNLNDELRFGGTVEVDVQDGFWHYKYHCLGADLRDYLDRNRIIIKILLQQKFALNVLF